MRDNYRKVMIVQELLNAFQNIERDKASRAALGQLSVPEIDTRILQSISELKQAIQAFDQLSSQMPERTFGAYHALFQSIQKVKNSHPDQFIVQRQSLIDQVDDDWDGTREVWSIIAQPLLIANVGALRDANPEATVASELQKASQQIKAEAAEILEKANKRSLEIIGEARASARGFSIESAQGQFNDASRILKWKAIGWGGSAAILLAAFIGFCIYIYRNPPALSAERHDILLAQAVYFSLIRVTILTVLGTVLSFTLKMLRAHLHMAEVNNHRRRVANSMAAFVEASHTAEQRDLIFGKLVDSVVNFGDSGLLTREQDGTSVPNIAFEAITKNLNSK